MQLNSGAAKIYTYIYIYTHTPEGNITPHEDLLASPNHPYHLVSFSGASLVAQLVNNLPAMWEIWVQSLGWKDPPEKERLPTPIFWPGIHSSTLLYKCLCNIYYYLYIY